MKKVIIFLFILGGFLILFYIHIDQMKLEAKRDEYKSSIENIKKNNKGLIKKRGRLKRANYETIREKATKLGFIKKEERVIRFYKPKEKL